MKVGKMLNTNTPVITERDSSVKADKTSTCFASDLILHADNQSKDKLNKLLNQITQQGAKLSQSPTFAELKAYRELVRQFLSESVARMYVLQSQHGWDRHGRHKMYTVIKQIDDNLASLAEDVRIGQERQLAIMEKLDSIRGMLVDLYT